jgi:ketosteroid isomerase-like protein
MATANNKAAGEAQIRALIDDPIKAVRTKDVSGLLASYAPDVLVFDLVKPLQYCGSDALRKRATEWLSSFEGPVGYEVRDLSISGRRRRSLLPQPQPGHGNDDTGK